MSACPAYERKAECACRHCRGVCLCHRPLLPLCPPEALAEELQDIACERDRALSRPAVCPERRAEWLADLERWRVALARQMKDA